MDAMKNRARAFAEGIVVMVCPVLLAITFQKVDLKTKVNRFVWGICPIAAITLEACLFPFLFLLASKNLDLAVLFPRLSRWLFGISKLLIHLCALLQMFLAFGFLFLINRKNLLYLIYLVPFMAFTVWQCYWTVQNDVITDESLYQECEGVLERSLDFSSVVTGILFLGLEGLALEGQSNGVKGLELLLAVSLGFSFMTCVGGILIMLLGAVPILIADSAAARFKLRRIVEILNISLGVGIGLTVLLITAAALNWLTLLAFIPLAVSLMVCLFVILSDDGTGSMQIVVQEQVKPASMELTKVTYTGFLAVSVPTFGSKSLSSYSHAFILLTAAAVITGIVWRLLTHITPSTFVMQKAVKRTVNVASVGAHLCIAAAVIPFTVMAFHALK